MGEPVSPWGILVNRSGRVSEPDKWTFGESCGRTSFFRFVGNYLGNSLGVQARAGKYDRVELSQDPCARV